MVPAQRGRHGIRGAAGVAPPVSSVDDGANHFDRPRNHVGLAMVVKPELTDEGLGIPEDALR
eukprot:11396827-Alexandrium_andersonii.AAC.1